MRAAFQRRKRYLHTRLGLAGRLNHDVVRRAAKQPMILQQRNFSCVRSTAHFVDVCAYLHFISGKAQACEHTLRAGTSMSQRAAMSTAGTARACAINVRPNPPLAPVSATRTRRCLSSAKSSS